MEPACDSSGRVDSLMTDSSDTLEQRSSLPRRKLLRRLAIGMTLLTLVAAAAGGVWWWRNYLAVQRRLAELEKEKAAEVLVGEEASLDDHPLTPAIKLAREILDRFRKEVDGYSATMIKQERVDGQLFPRTTMFTRVLEKRPGKDGQIQPLSVYVRFDEPASQRGREVIWVEGRNEGNMIVHEGGLLGFKRLALKPTGVLAMAGSRYPITDAGIDRLLFKMLARVLRDRSQDGESELEIVREVMVGDEKCIRIVIRHPSEDENFDFSRAEVVIEPLGFRYLRYAAYGWPTEDQPEGELIEEYIYQDVMINPGLSDSDFDPDNPLYKFP